uniref:Ankyrin repeat protein n=1 Tax=viral metagenome TaxID=1070528 RepID=A0A6C0LY15_9ZZZZ
MSSVCKKCLKTIKRERVVVTSDGRIGCICDRKSSHDLYHKTKETVRSKDVSLKRYGSIDSIIEHVRIGDLATVKEMASMYDENRGYVISKIVMAAAEYDQPDIIVEFYTQYDDAVSQFLHNNDMAGMREFYEKHTRGMDMIAAVIKALVLGNKRAFEAFCTRDIIRNTHEMFMYTAIRDGTYKTLDILLEYEDGDRIGCAEVAAFYGNIDFIKYILNVSRNVETDVMNCMFEAARGNQPLVFRFFHEEYNEVFMKRLDRVFANAELDIDIAIMLHDEYGATSVKRCMLNAIMNGRYDLMVLCHDVWGVECDERVVEEVVRIHANEDLNIAFVDKLCEWGVDTSVIVRMAQKYFDEVIVRRVAEWAV